MFVHDIVIKVCFDVVALVALLTSISLSEFLPCPVEIKTLGEH